MESNLASNYDGKGTTLIQQQGETESVYGSTVEKQRREPMEPRELYINKTGMG
jgi:hypothetical protein